MPKNSNDELVRQVRESRKRKIQEASDRAAEKVIEIVSHGLKRKSKPTVQTVSEMIAKEFDALVG
jgi:vacuolar-type H+-ATPase subunit H